MPLPVWEWVLSADDRAHTDRISLIRVIPYELTRSRQLGAFGEFGGEQGKALLLNISSQGMLLMAEVPFTVMQILNVKVPSEIKTTQIPTLAEVVWTRPVPMLPDRVHFVGVRFLL